MVFLSLVAVALILAGALYSPLFDVDRIAVSGTSHLDVTAVVDASGVSTGDHLATIDLAEVRSRVMSQPWIASAHVTRSWPGTLNIRVTEQRPVLNVTGTDGTVVMSRTGTVVQSGDKADPALPNLEVRVDVAGEHAPGEVGASSTAVVGQPLDPSIEGAADVFNRIPPDLADQLDDATFDTDGILTFHLDDGADIVFGSPDHVAAKMTSIAAVLTQVQLDCMKRLDVREPSRVALSRGPGCPGISPATDTESSEH